MRTPASLANLVDPIKIRFAVRRPAESALLTSAIGQGRALRRAPMSLIRNSQAERAPLPDAKVKLKTAGHTHTTLDEAEYC